MLRLGQGSPMVVFQSDLSRLTVSILQDRVDNIINRVRILIICLNYSMDWGIVNLELGGIAWQNLVSRWCSVR